MLYTSNLLKRYISLNVDIKKIAQQLTLKTCEVEEIRQTTIPDLVVIGKVIKEEHHPDADRLSVCQVDCGAKGSYQICCGATNVDKDTYVAVALPGCHLPAINLTIEPREIRGKESNGMICSKAELGIPEDLDEKRIWILQWVGGKLGDMDDITESDVGKSLGEKYPWLNSWTIDVDNKTITHRPDLFGHFGLSNELQAIFPSQTTFSGAEKYRKQMKEESPFQLLDQADKTTRQIGIQSAGVRSYVLLELNNVSWKTSDMYLRSIAHNLDLSPKANWVDFSNIFMYLTGQPIHFFDEKKVAGNIIVREAVDGEVFTDLFDKEYHLTEQDIIIADDEKILALAGIIGSNTSGIDETTTDILVEIANFDDVQVRKTAMRLGLRTDAQVRFEKDIHPLFSLHILPFFLDELAYFKKSLGNYDLGGVQRWVGDNNSTPVRQQVLLDTLEVEKIIFGSDGTTTHISDEEIAIILHSLGCQVSDDRQVYIPHRRGSGDITCSADLIEEIARIYGFDNILELPYKDSNSFVEFESEVVQQRVLEDLLCRTLQYDQIETYPWLHQRWIELLGYETTDGLYTMKDIDSAEQKYLRSNITASLLEVIEKNTHFISSGKVFDIGKTWLQGREKPEHNVLGLAQWKKEISARSDHPFLHLRTHITQVFTTLGVRGKITFVPTEDALRHPKQQAEIMVNKEVIGIIATVHPSLAQTLKLPTHIQTSLAQLDLTLLQAYIPDAKKLKQTNYKTLQDQFIEKDLSFVLPKDMNYGIVTQALAKIRDIHRVNVFDLYQGEHLPDDQKSITVRFSIHTPASSDPLTNEQIGDIMNKAIAAGEKVGASLR